MFRSPYVSIVTLMLLCLAFGCSKSTKNQNGIEDDPLQRIDSTPMENEETELIALCLSGELVAPDGLYERVLSDMTAIRAAFGDSIHAIVQITFWTPWPAGYLMIGFDDTTVAKIREGEYHAWDDLNEQYRVERVDTSMINIMGIVQLHFVGRLHPYRLQEAYTGLPGAWAVSPSGNGIDRPNVYARQAVTGITYLFRNGWNDCPSGCIDNEFWYFSCEGQQPEFVGYWPAYEGIPPPDWWEDARLNKEHYCD